MAKPTVNLFGIKSLVKAIIALAVIVAIIAIIIVIIANLTLSQMKIDEVKLGDTTLAELGLSEMKVKTVVGAAWQLCTASEEDFVTKPYANGDATAANNTFDKLPKTTNNVPNYLTLLATTADVAENKLHTLSDRSLAYIYNQIFASGNADLGDIQKLGLEVKSVTITDDQETQENHIIVVFAIDITSITKDLPSIPFLEWPKEAYLQYSAKINVSEEGVFDVVEPGFNINGVEKETTNAMLTALGKTLAIELAEGKTLDGVILETISTTTTKVVANMGRICNVGGISAETAEIVYANNAGVGNGTITFRKY